MQSKFPDSETGGTRCAGRSLPRSAEKGKTGGNHARARPPRPVRSDRHDASGLSPYLAVQIGIVNKCFDLFEKEIVRGCRAHADSGRLDAAGCFLEEIRMVTEEALTHEMELESRIRNLVWTVSGGSALKLNPDVQAVCVKSRIRCCTTRCPQAPFRCHFDREAYSLYLVKKVYSGAAR